MNIHIIGIAGVGMSATALLLKQSGWQVTGSDAESYGPPKEILAHAGIDFSIGYDPKNIPSDTDCFIVGRNAKLDPSVNSEVQAARASGKPVYSFPEMLGTLTKERTNVVVAGSYGKSTTTALTAHLLRYAGIDAGYFVGAEPSTSPWLPFPSQLGSVPTFVLEGDEYPSAHDDPRAKFLHLHPHDVILTSVVHDHVNVYPTMSDYEKPFHELLALLPVDGFIVVCADEPGALALANISGKRVITYGLTNGTYRAKNISLGSRSSFTLFKNDMEIGRYTTSLLGRHNIEDITAAATYVLERRLVTPDALTSAIANFPGIRRRLDNIAPTSSVPVFEGFGSSYEKARAAIVAIKEHFPKEPLVIVFEPHTFGWRNRANLHWYDDVFKEAGSVFVAPPETQGASTHDQLSHEEILSRIGTSARAYEEPASVTETLTGNEVVLVLSSGDLHGSLTSLAKEIGARFAK